MCAVSVKMSSGNQACWCTLYNCLYFFGSFFLGLNCFCVLVGLQQVAALEKINKDLFEMQGARFSKEPRAGFLPIWCLQAGPDFPMNSASSTG